MLLVLGGALLSKRDKLAESDCIFLSNQRRLLIELVVCRIDTFVLIPKSNFLRPSETSNEVDESFGRTRIDGLSF